MAARHNSHSRRWISAAFGILAGSGLAAGAAVARDASGEGSIDVEARLSQRVLKSGERQRVYLRIAIKGRQAAGQESRRSPVNVALVIDRSGSMRGDKIVKAREAAVMAVDRLSSNDTGAVVIFDNHVDVLVPATRVTSHDLFRDRIAEATARGNTAIFAAMQEAAREVRKFKRPGTLSRIVLMSDGLANVGPTQPADFQRLGQELGSEGITVTTIGLGSGYNEDLMARLASASDGNHAYARSAGDLTRIFNQEFDEVLSVTAQEIEVLIETRGGVKPIRTLGRDGEIDGNRVRMKVAQAYGTAEYSLQVELEVPDGMALDAAALADVQVNYTASGSNARRSTTARVEGRFSRSDDEVRASIDPTVMAPIIELQTRERTEAAVELRDKGRIQEARQAFEADARANRASREKYKLSGEALKKLEMLERKSQEAAVQVSDEAKWATQRKAQRELQSNAPAGASASGTVRKY